MLYIITNNLSKEMPSTSSTNSMRILRKAAHFRQINALLSALA